MRPYSNVSRIYDPITNEVYCDWRLAVSDCVGANALWWIYVINLILCCILVILGSTLLIRRFMMHGFSFLNNINGTGFLRPRPIECFIGCLIIYHFVFIIIDVLMLLDAFPNNTVTEFIWEFPWPAAFTAVTLYVVGIIGNISHMNRGNTIQSQWLPSSNMVDVIGCILIFCPMIFNYTFAILSGYFADTGNDAIAVLFIHLHFGCWAIWCLLLLFLNAYFGWKLSSLIDKHLSEFQFAGTGIAAIKTGLTKLRIILLEIAIALFFFFSAVVIYTACRQKILVSPTVSIVYGYLCILILPVLSMIGLVVIIIRPLEDYSISSYRRSSGPRSSIAKDSHRPSTASQYRPESFVPPRASYISRNNGSNNRLFEDLNKSWTQLEELDESDMTEGAPSN